MANVHPRHPFSEATSFKSVQVVPPKILLAAPAKILYCIKSTKYPVVQIRPPADLVTTNSYPKQNGAAIFPWAIAASHTPEPCGLMQQEQTGAQQLGMHCTGAGDRAPS